MSRANKLPAMATKSDLLNYFPHSFIDTTASLMRNGTNKKHIILRRADMPKSILIFSDGAGQVGGLRPDQSLSNIYKMYRAMHPGPSSPISPLQQVCYYDPGLGADEVGGFPRRPPAQG